MRFGAQDSGPSYHGTKADPKSADLLDPGYSSNYGERRKANYVYLTATLDAATWGAELAVGEGPGRIYRVEPHGPFEDDPNLTDKRFPGNPTSSYRTREPLRIVGEVLNWEDTPLRCSRTCGTAEHSRGPGAGYSPAAPSGVGSVSGRSGCLSRRAGWQSVEAAPRLWTRRVPSEMIGPQLCSAVGVNLNFQKEPRCYSRLIGSSMAGPRRCSAIG